MNANTGSTDPEANAAPGQNTLDPGSAAHLILAALAQRPAAYLVGIAGIPGSGKTTVCRSLLALRPDAKVVPMDGYHLPRSVLRPEDLARRGAPHTFDPAGFRRDLQRLKETRSGVFPEFDHAEQDPRADAISIRPEVPLIFVEGIYVLMQSWGLEPLFDFRVFLDCSLETTLERLTIRHVECGLSKNSDEARHRAQNNDHVNALAILRDGCRERADLVLKT